MLYFVSVVLDMAKLRSGDFGTFETAIFFLAKEKQNVWRDRGQKEIKINN